MAKKRPAAGGRKSETGFIPARLRVLCALALKIVARISLLAFPRTFCQIATDENSRRFGPAPGQQPVGGNGG
jgi:hypothetical protein